MGGTSLNTAKRVRLRHKRASRAISTRSKLNLELFVGSCTSLPSLDRVIEPEKSLPIDDLETYVTSKEKRVPIFGYPIISFNLNSYNMDKEKFLWGLVAKKIISKDTKRCLVKDFMDGYKANQIREK